MLSLMAMAGGISEHMLTSWSSCVSPSIQFSGGGWVWRRCRVSYVTGGSNWDWLTVGQGLLSLSQVRVEGGMFLFLLFLHFHSCPSFLPVPLFHLLYYLFCLLSPFLWETTKWPTMVDVSLNPNSVNQSVSFLNNYYIYNHLIWHILSP